jgi:hypothetical protein
MSLRAFRATMPTLLVITGAVLFAFAHRAGAESTKVRIEYDRTNPAPPAEFVPLGAGEKEEAPQACLDATGQNQFRTNSTFKKEQLVSWKQQEYCAQGVADATVLEQKIADLKAGIAIAENAIYSLAFSLKEASALTTLNGSALFTIPVGEEWEKTYARAEKVALKCAQGIQPIGRSESDKVAILSADNAKLARQLARAREHNINTHRAYSAALQATGATADTEKAALDQLTALKTIFGDAFIAVPKSALSAYYKSAEAAGNILSTSVAVDVGPFGQKYPCETPYALGGFAGKWVKGTIVVDGLAYESACIPEMYIIEKTKEGFNENIAFFEKKKKKYQKTLVPLEKELAKLKAANYNCATAENLAASLPAEAPPENRIVRKSTMPNTPAPPASDPALSSLAPGELPQEVRDFLSSSPTVRPTPSRLVKKSTVPKTPSSDINEGPELIPSSYSYTYNEEIVPNDPTKADERTRTSIQRSWGASGGKERVTIIMPHKALSRWYDIERETTWPAEQWPPSKEGVMKQTIITKTDRKTSESTVGPFVPGPLFNHFLLGETKGRYAAQVQSTTRVKGSMVSISETLNTKMTLRVHGDPQKTYKIQLYPRGYTFRIDENFGVTKYLMDYKDFTISGKPWSSEEYGFIIRAKGESEIDVTPTAAGNYVITDINFTFKDANEPSPSPPPAGTPHVARKRSPDVKANGSDKVVLVKRGESVSLWWDFGDYGDCSMNWDYDLRKTVVQGTTRVLGILPTATKEYTLTCRDENHVPAASDSVWIVVVEPTKPPATTKIQELQEQIEALQKDRDSLKLQLQEIRRQKGYAPSPSPAEKLNMKRQEAPYITTPRREQLGNISEVLLREFETLLRMR